MASGILGKASLSAATNTTLYTVPAATTTTLNISVCNLGTSGTARIQLAASATGTPAATEYFEYNTILNANQVLERTGIVVATGTNIVAFSDTPNITVMVWGVEN